METAKPITRIAQWWKCTNEEYHADTAKISRSMLDTFRESPKRYREQYIDKTYLSEPTEALIVGSLVHWFVLDHGLDIAISNSPYAVEPKCDRRTKEGKLIAAEFIETSKGKQVVEQKHWDLARKCSIALVTSRYKHLLIGDDGFNEHAITWRDEDTGLACKCKIDRVRDHCLPDIKTTIDARPEAFAKAIQNHGYYRQAEWYQRGYELATGEYMPLAFIVVSKDTFDVACYDVAERDIRDARQENDETLAEIRECHESGDWSASWQREIITLSRPAWARKREYAYDNGTG